MKILKLKNSLLFIRIHPEDDTAKCFFIFFISWNCFKIEEQIFDLNILNMSQIKEFYKIAADEYTCKYRVS